MNRLTGSVFTTVLALVLSAGAGAVEMAAAPGFGGVCKLGAWTPITVKLKNTSTDRFSGSMAIADPLTQQPSASRTPFDLPGPSQKRYTHYVLMDQVGGEITVQLIPKRGWFSGKNVEARIQVTTVDDSSSLVVAAGPPRANMNFLAGEKLRVWTMSPVSGSPTMLYTVITALVDPADLPDRPLGYDGVQFLVLSEVAPSILDAKQLTALKMWVASGGILVVNGGPNYQALQNDFYADLLPLQITGATELADLRSLEAECKHPLPPGRVVVTTGKLKPGAAAWLAQDGVPLVTTWQFGLGAVYFMAFDYTSFPLKGWDGQVHLWKELFHRTSTRFPIASPASFMDTQQGMPGAPKRTTAPPHNQRKTFNRSYASSGNPIESITNVFPAISTPSFEIILCFLIAYLFCLVPLNYFVLTRKRRELAWVAIPAVVLVFTLGAYGMGYAMKGGKLLLKTASVVEAGPNTRFASATTYSCLFSPSRRDYELELDDPYTIISESMTEDGGRSITSAVRGADVLIGETTVLPNLRMDMWSARTFRSESAVDLGGHLTANLRLDPVRGRISGTIRNDTEIDLRECRIVTGGHISPIADLKKGSSIPVDIRFAGQAGAVVPGASPAPPPPGPYPSPTPVYGYPGGQPDSSASVTQQMAGQVIPFVQADKGAAVVGWSESASARIRLTNGRAQNQAATCYIFWLPEGGVVR